MLEHCLLSIIIIISFIVTAVVANGSSWFNFEQMIFMLNTQKVPVQDPNWVSIKLRFEAQLRDEAKVRHVKTSSHNVRLKDGRRPNMKHSKSKSILQNVNMRADFWKLKVVEGENVVCHMQIVFESEGVCERVSMNRKLNKSFQFKKVD